MQQSGRPVSKRDRFVGLIRWSIVSVGVIMTSVIVLVVIQQMKNEIVLVNNTSAPVEFKLATLMPEHGNDLTVPAHSKTKQTLGGPHGRPIVFMNKRTRVFSNDIRVYSVGMNLPRWGNRIAIVEDEQRSTSISKSTLRTWFDKSRGWIPLPAAWMY